MAIVSYLPSRRTNDAGDATDAYDDSEVDKDNDKDNSVVILNGAGNKPRILALHGGGGNGADFSRQQGVRDLADALSQFEFVFANAPEAGGLWLLDPPSKAQPTTDSNWAGRSISYLDSFVAEHGPFYGLMGYSQGTPMSLVYLAHAPANTFQKVALFNGYAPTTHQGLLANIDRAAPFATNTLVFSGANDGFASMSPGLAARFQSPLEVQSRTAGHHLPFSSDACLFAGRLFLPVRCERRQGDTETLTRQPPALLMIKTRTRVCEAREFIILHNKRMNRSRKMPGWARFAPSCQVPAWLS